MTSVALSTESAGRSDTLPARKHGSQSGYRPDIDGLRSIAILSVVAFHAEIPMFSGGYVGVDIFFVISGYLIGAHIYREVTEGRFSIASFYQRRAKRILPPLFVVLLFCYAISLLLLDPAEIKEFAQYVVATILSASNILAWKKASYFAGGSSQHPLLMTWSLGVEEQFYLVLPLMMLWLRRVSQRKVLLFTGVAIVASLCLSVVGLYGASTATFYLLPTRAWELAAGVMLAVYETGQREESLYKAGRFANITGSMGLALLLWPVFSYGKMTLFPGIDAVPPVAGSMLIIISRKGWVNRLLLSSKPLVAVGLVSYSWYLWHWPLLSFANISVDRPISPIVGGTIGLFSLGIAWLSYRFVEQPFRKSRTAPLPLLRKYGVACLLMLLPAVAILALKGWPGRFPKLAAIETKSHIEHRDVCLASYGATAPNLSPYCAPEAGTRSAIALLGDSHAAALGPAIRAMASQNGLDFFEMTKSSCPPLKGVTRWMPDHRRHASECAVFNAKVLRFVQSHPHIRTVVLAGYWSSPLIDEPLGYHYQKVNGSGAASPAENAADLREGLNALIEDLEFAGKRVIVIQDTPRFDFDPLNAVRMTGIPARRAVAALLTHDVSRPGWVWKNQTAAKEDEAAALLVQSALTPETQIYDPKNSLCVQEKCFYEKDGLLLYSDPQHISGAGSFVALNSFQFNASAKSE